MASYTRPPGPNGAIPPNYSHQLPAPPLSHNSSYPPPQSLPSMAPSTNGSGPYGATPSYSQPPQPYQHHQPPYQGQSPHQQQHQSQQRPPPSHQQQPYQQQQPPPQHQPPRSHASPASTSPTQPQSQATAGEGAGKLEPVSIVVNGRRYAEVDVNTIDFAQYVVTVDLWDETGTREVNLVRSTTATPAISSTIHESFNNLETMPYRAANIAPYPPSHPSQMTLYSQHQSPVSPYAPNQYGQVQNYPAPASNGFGQPSYGYSNDFTPMYRPPQVYEPGMGGPQRLSIGGAPNSSIQGMFTRNLIGNCAGSAFRLHDTKDKIGIWLRFSFVDVKPAADQKGDVPVKTGKAPILASVFSDVFQVYSAKKFPGVCDSTELSKCFAQQGIKIPIRKEGGKGDPLKA
ncbi:hypothetical protein VSDG_02253 [Cytospora chrysosperma]|uniref:Velvet domain-containing protein n=1 Tax=Cytospora chrysosperma TaxID=252740 RepID=A0A423WEJ7_CYTCH|nr:hypothetical protein VSDG_02253 [Valsa sordida]